MISLERMNEEQFISYCDYFVADYAIEIEENYRKTIDQATIIASQELKDDLPEGVHTKNNIILCIEIEEEMDRKLIGYLWYKKNIDDSNIFIFDFYIFPQYRSMGYGKECIAILEKNMRKEGVGQVKLRVAYSNVRALALYKELGFEITGINMSKNIRENEES